MKQKVISCRTVATEGPVRGGIAKVVVVSGARDGYTKLTLHVTIAHYCIFKLQRNMSANEYIDGHEEHPYL